MNTMKIILNAETQRTRRTVTDSALVRILCVSALKVFFGFGTSDFGFPAPPGCVHLWLKLGGQ